MIRLLGIRYDIEIIFAHTITVVLYPAGPVIVINTYVNCPGVCIKRVLDQLGNELHERSQYDG
jgi:hypothetical protein